MTSVSSEKALQPSWVLSGTVTETSAVHFQNAHTPMLVNPSGKVTEARQVHAWNALSPMLVNPSGKVTEVSPMH